MTAFLLPEGKQSYETATGAPAVGWKLYTTDTGTTNPRTTWSDAAQVTPNANPIVMDARGECVVFWLGAYRVRLEDNLGNTIWTVEGVSAVDFSSALIADLIASNNGTKGAGMIGFGPTVTYVSNTVGSFLNSIYARTAAEIAASVTPTLYYYPPGDIRRYGAIGDGGTTDNSTAILNACKQSFNGGATVVIPGAASFYKCLTAIALTSGCRIISDGTQPTLRFWGVNGFVLAAGAANLNISGIEIFGCDASGNADPKTFSGVVCSGTTGSHNNYVFLKDLYMRGWNRCIDESYTWSSIIENVTTLNCNVGVYMFGQCVINTIANCRLTANTGTHSVQLVKDAGVRGEGLYISNTLMASGTFGVKSDGWLGLHIDNCELDQITDTAIDVTNCNALGVNSCWIFATNYGIRWQDLGGLVAQQASIVGNRIETTAANSRPLHAGALNSNISIVGGELICGATGTARCLYIESFTTDVDISMVGTNLTNPNSATANAIFAGSMGFRHAGLTGDVTIQYSTPDSYVGTLTQVTGTPTGTVVFSETADLITLQIPSILGASPNVNQPLITGMPAGIRPLTQQIVTGIVQNNSVDAVSKIAVETSGNLTLYTGVAAAFTAANNKGIPACTITYRRM